MTINKSTSTPFFPPKMTRCFSSLSQLGLKASTSSPNIKSQFLSKIGGPLKRMTSSLFNNKVKRERESSFGSTVEWDGPEDAQYREDRRVKVMHRKSVMTGSPVLLRHDVDYCSRAFSPDWTKTFPSRSAVAPPRPPRPPREEVDVQVVPLRRTYTLDRVSRSRGASVSTSIYENRPKNIPNLSHSRSLSGLPTLGLGLDFLDMNGSELDFTTTVLNASQKRESIMFGNLALNEAIHSFFDHAEGIKRDESSWSDSEGEESCEEDDDENWPDRGERLIANYLPTPHRQSFNSFSSNDFSSKDSLVDPESNLFNNFPRISVESFPNFDDINRITTPRIKNLLSTVETYHDCDSKSILPSSDEEETVTPVLSSVSSCESLGSSNTLSAGSTKARASVVPALDSTKEFTLDLRTLDSASLSLLCGGVEGINVQDWRRRSAIM